MNVLELEIPKKWTKSTLFKMLTKLETGTNGTVWFDRQGNDVYVFIRLPQKPNTGIEWDQARCLETLFSGLVHESAKFDRLSCQIVLKIEPKFKI